MVECDPKNFTIDSKRYTCQPKIEKYEVQKKGECNHDTGLFQWNMEIIERPVACILKLASEESTSSGSDV